ncbi:MAG TPA: ATP-binding protein, partial [Thermoanaerobaculia bacterium]|nr:ATP-binding protein [Thermoanaerobaculia bacterium]
MGSSPVTATISPLRAAIEGCLAGEAWASPGDLLLLAFSGGADSTALLLAMTELAPARGWRLLAAHVDHGLDPGSTGRAAAAAALAAR